MTLGVRSIHVPEIANAVSVTRSTILYPILSPMKPIFSKNKIYSAEIKKTYSAELSHQSTSFKKGTLPKRE